MHLETLGYAIEVAGDGESGLKKAQSEDYALIVLDRGLPKIDGLSVCREIRKCGKRVPILMLTSRADELDKVAGLDMGADDYVGKPFALAELLARVKALLRRSAYQTNAPIDAEPEDLKVGELLISPAKRKVFIGETEIELTAKEFDLLYYLARNPGRTYTREQILAAVWETDIEGYEQSVNALIKRLRRKLTEAPCERELIETVRGVGYRFAEPE